MGYKVTGTLHADRLVYRELKRGDWWIKFAKIDNKPEGLYQALQNCPGQKEWVLEGNVSIPAFTKVEPPRQCSFLEVIPLLRAFPGSVAVATGKTYHRSYSCRWANDRIEFRWERGEWEPTQVDSGDLDETWLYYPEGIPAE